MRLGLLIFGIIGSVTAAAQNPPEQPVDLSVAGDAWSRAAPDRLRVTFLVEGVGSTAIEAVSKAETKEKAALSAVTGAGVSDLRSERQEERFAPFDGKGEVLLPGTTVKHERLVTLETDDVGNAPVVIDALLRGGATSIVEVTYAVRNAVEERDRAIDEAAATAQRQAERLAASLNVKLGPLLSAAVTEEPGGKILRLHRERGEDPPSTDRESHWIVNLRYSIVRGGDPLT